MVDSGIRTCHIWIPSRGDNQRCIISDTNGSADELCAPLAKSWNGKKTQKTELIFSYRKKIRRETKTFNFSFSTKFATISVPQKFMITGDS